MKKLLVLLLMVAAASPVFGFPKVALVERFTNASCGPCATLNNAWYTSTVRNLRDQGYLHHIVYNVNWPGANDPMYLLNAADNMARRGLYGVNSVPWIEVDGETFVRSGNTAVDQANFTNLVTNTFNSGYSPFQVEVQAEIFSGDIIDVLVTVTRDPADTTVLPEAVTLQIGLVETMVSYANPPGSNGETDFPDVCRKMLDDASGTSLTVPAPGESVTTSVLYIPSPEAQGVVDFGQVSILAFLQDNQTREVFQSTIEPTTFTDSIHAAFRATETVGAAPLMVTFEDLSSPASARPITSWQWDLDGDGSVDSTAPEPSWTYSTPGAYTVVLTVGDGVDSHTTTRQDFVFAVSNQADILVVNGIEYQTYPAEMESFYDGSAISGSHQVDVWDLFADQGYDYLANPSVSQVVSMSRRIPDSVLQLYRTVIWVGNNYSGDLDYYDGAQVLDYVGGGGNFILATRLGGSFLTSAIRQYCGITAVTPDRTVTQLQAQDSNLVNMSTTGTNSLVHLVVLGAASEAVPIFIDPTVPSYTAGFRLQKQGEGTFIYVAGRPYRYNTSSSYQNYNYMLDNWTGGVSGVGDEPNLMNRPVVLMQNQPNPFNPSTVIRFSLEDAGHVSLKVYDAAGRRVRTLVNDTRTPSEYSVTWDGRDDAGAGVAAGVYLYRLETAQGTETRRMVLVK
jgi:PKD repeat protein